MTNLQPHKLLVSGTANYFPHIAVLIKSYVAFHRHPTIFIITHNIKDPNDVAIKELKEEFANYQNLEIQLHYIDPKLFVSWGVDEETAKHPHMLRLALPTLPYDGKVLYVDVDTLFTNNLDELFTRADDFLQGKSIACCPDVQDIFDKFQRKSPYQTDILPPKFYELPFGTKGNVYFNSGVMLIDLEKIRQSPDVNKNLWQYYMPSIFENGKFTNLDQTFLNIVHFYDKSLISNKYNFFAFFLTQTRFFIDFDKWTNYEKALAEGKVEPPLYPSIIHFLTISPYKAWDSPLVDFQDLYNFYKNQTVSEIITKNVEYYFKMMINYYNHYRYTPGLIDFGNYDKFVNDLTIEKVSKSVGLFSKPWSVSPIFLLTFLYRARGLRKFRHKGKAGYDIRMQSEIEHSKNNFIPIKDLAEK
ncbi:glycosyltransferase family 8 protein [Psittacicella gerlachiana]|uniref:Glycosyltransferase family 8 protein n=1 Tax=Psittacicella gerlachiana TaxID=2028574 RepID=A0A3A1YD52_9GAMM|nr:glycosyltransferase [Psittacicella gerlachiana]RIY35595.1 hypothetical protein CKF59_03360 [Psittacicella gerlachiana]